MQEENYLPLLPEDKILLDKIKTGPLSTGMALEEQKREMIIIQTEATLRNRKTMIDLDKSNKNLSLIVASFALIQIVIAVTQFSFELLTFPNKVVGIIELVLFAGLLFIIFRRIKKDTN